MSVSGVRLGRAPAVHERVLDNGLKVLLVENRTIPSVSIHASVFAGSRHERKEKAGLAIMASRLLDEGTTRRTSLEIAEAIESVGGAIDTDGSYERTMLSSSVLTKDVGLAIDLAADILINPQFPEDAIAKEQERTIAEIASAMDRPQVVAGWAFNKLIYGRHPLGRPTHGYRETVAAITRDDLVEFHDRHFAPNNALLSIVGDVTIDEIWPDIQRHFSSWKPKTIPTARHARPVRQKDKREKRIVMPAEQVNIYLGHLGIERGNPDYYALQTLDTILGSGAGFTARIPQRLRDEMGLAYTTFAGITMTAGLEPGKFIAFIGTSPENTALAIEGLLGEVRRIVKEPVTADELKDAQDYLTGSFVFAFESSSQIARFLTHAEVYGLGFDFIEKYPEYINKVTIDDVARVARKYLDYENYSLVVVGPDVASVVS
ncbi:MAG TPA: pitrilysin family protein [Terriglobia bacterium]|nr:pitrilysin family protein [Terriglobia bacterium]